MLEIALTVVVAVSAMFAFLIQRARYLREIEPDLDLECRGQVRLTDMSDSLAEDWSFFLDVRISNKSETNHAYDVHLEPELAIWPAAPWATRFVTARFIEKMGPPAEILADRTVDMPLKFDPHYARDYIVREYSQAF